jgi:hypothetical protein
VRVRTSMLASSLALLILSGHVAASTFSVSTATQLTQALKSVRAGDVITLAPGLYKGRFVGTAIGYSTKRITLQGPRTAVLDAGSVNTGYALYLNGARYWTVRGITVQNALKGIILDNSSYNVLEDVAVSNVGTTGVHFRRHSSYNTLQNSVISYTGLQEPGYGEGVYIGSAKSNWSTYTSGSPDRSDKNKVLNNTIGPYVAAESIDVKEGTTGGEIRANYFDATGMTGANYADSWIDVKGNGYIINNNFGFNGASSALLDGMQVHVAVSGWGNNNSFSENQLSVGALGYGFLVEKGATGNKIYASNIVVGAIKGLANISVLLQ